MLVVSSTGALRVAAPVLGSIDCVTKSMVMGTSWSLGKPTGGTFAQSEACVATVHAVFASPPQFPFPVASRLMQSLPAKLVNSAACAGGCVAMAWGKSARSLGSGMSGGLPVGSNTA